MINKKFFFYLLILKCVFFIVKANEPFTFEVSEIEIKDKGNIIIGKNKGIIKTNNDLIIEANNFSFNKIKNELNASGNVIINNRVGKFIIKANEIVYFKNTEVVYAKGNVSAFLEKKYNFESNNISLNLNTMELSSNNDSKIFYKDKLFELENFKYLINPKLLKAENVIITEKYKSPNQDRNQLFFESIFFDMEKNSFQSNNVKILLNKNLFGQLDNDPRLLGVSSNSSDGITNINKGIFTTCKISEEKCPPWSIKADKITHDKNKKKLIYNNAILQLYNIPVLYFPKFFHPDPTVERQSGFLRPQINQSNSLGTSLYLPYYFALSSDSDFTFKPTIFNSDVTMLQSEFRKQNKNSYFEADVNFVKGYSSKTTNKKKNINHLFSKLIIDLRANNFNKSDLNFYIEKTNNNNYLKVFEPVLSNTILKPENNETLKSGLDLYLEKNNYNVLLGVKSFENLLEKNNDRYQYIFPYYHFISKPYLDKLGSISFNSTGSNSLINTNNLKTKIINNLYFNSEELFENDYGFKNELGLYFKNLNSLGKNDLTYENSPKVELMTLFEAKTSYPLVKRNKDTLTYLSPKISFRTNPSKINDYSSEDRKIDITNIFEINRLGLNDILEPGTSLTIGSEFKKENLKNEAIFLNFDIAKVLRDTEEEKIPNKSTLNKKNSHIFGSIEAGLSKNFNVDYNFALNDVSKNFNYNSIDLNFSINNFVTNFNFIEENGEIGSKNLLQNTTTYKFDENNYISFNARKNRKINLTEYYDLVYEYKNDCLIAGIKFKKTYYEDRDLKPSEDLIFSITLYPLTTFEQKVSQKNN